MPKRGRVPNKYFQVLKLLEPCQGYENGKTIDDIARAMYNDASDFHAKAMARQLIGGARKLTRKIGIKADIASINVGNERRYCHLSTVAEYGKAINAFEAHIDGTKKTNKDLTQLRDTIDERRRLEEARKVASKAKQEQRQEETQKSEEKKKS